MQIVNWLAQFKPKQLTKQQLVKPIVESLCKLCGEADPEDHDQDDQLSASKFASQVGTLDCTDTVKLLESFLAINKYFSPNFKYVSR